MEQASEAALVLSRELCSLEVLVQEGHDVPAGLDPEAGPLGAIWQLPGVLVRRLEPYPPLARLALDGHVVASCPDVDSARVDVNPRVLRERPPLPQVI